MGRKKTTDQKKNNRKTPAEKREGRDKDWKKKVRISKTAAKAAIKKREKTHRVTADGVEAMQEVTVDYMKAVGHTTKELTKHRNRKTSDKYDVNLASRLTPKADHIPSLDEARRPEKSKRAKTPKPEKVKVPKAKKIKMEPIKGRLKTLPKKREKKIGPSDYLKIGNRWQAGGRDRIYFNLDIAKAAGLEIETYNTGNISSARYEGERISNSRAKKLVGSLPRKVYYDVKADKMVYEGASEDWSQEISSHIEKEIRKKQKKPRNKRQTRKRISEIDDKSPVKA